MRLIFQAFEWM